MHLPAGVALLAARTPEEALAHAATVDVLVYSGGRPIDDLLAAAPRLRLVQNTGSGVEKILTPAMTASPVWLANGRGVSASPIAEHVIALILALTRNLHISIRQQQEHRWDRLPARGTVVAGKTVGILGLGEIGRETAVKARALGMRVAAVRRGREVADLVDEWVADTGALCAVADYLVLSVPMAPSTERLVGEAELTRMKPTSYLINISRGGTVDEPALIRALQEGRLAGAGLDVTAVEPLPADSPLWDLPGVIITPHAAGANPHSGDRIAALIAESLRRLMAGEQPLNLVDKQRGY